MIGRERVWLVTDWAGPGTRSVTLQQAYDPLRTELYTAVVPWPAGEASADEAPPDLAAAAIRNHLDSPSQPPRHVVGDDTPAVVGAAPTPRRADSERDPRFTWSSPSAPVETPERPVPLLARRSRSGIPIWVYAAVLAVADVIRRIVLWQLDASTGAEVVSFVATICGAIAVLEAAALWPRRLAAGRRAQLSHEPTDARTGP